MRYAIIALLTISLTVSCAKAPSRALPDVVEYPKSVQVKAANELKVCPAPVVSGFLIDYHVMRKQTRALKGK